MTNARTQISLYGWVCVWRGLGLISKKMKMNNYEYNSCRYVHIYIYV